MESQGPKYIGSASVGGKEGDGSCSHTHEKKEGSNLLDLEHANTE